MNGVAREFWNEILDPRSPALETGKPKRGRIRVKRAARPARSLVRRSLSAAAR